MKSIVTFERIHLEVLAASLVLCVFTCCAQAEAPHLGRMKAERILFLGNSICLAPPGGEWNNFWGASASAQATDYVHLLTTRLNTATGGSLAVTPPSPIPDRWYAGNPLPKYTGNVLNVADVFERNFNTWDNARIRNQLDWKADIAVLQFGENMAGGSMEQFERALDDLLAGLKNSSNPHIFVTSHILGANPTVDGIKRRLCAKDPSHRVFVDLNSVWGDASTHGQFAHPNDKGMATIADLLFRAMAAHSAVK